MRARLASRELGSFFFKKVVLYLESADLFIQLGLEVSLALVGPNSGWVKEPFSALQQLAFPVANLRGMDPVVLGQLAGGFQPLEGFERHFSFELGRMLLPYTHRFNPFE